LSSKRNHRKRYGRVSRHKLRTAAQKKGACLFSMQPFVKMRHINMMGFFLNQQRLCRREGDTDEWIYFF
ncbi:MAG: hypothetical protein CO150_09310, partial [Nitrospirae bacterium CG_4_9_14_3_um_filter_53_35]